MKYLKEYNEDWYKNVKTYRKITNSRLIQGINRIGSVIDDILKLDFKALKQSFTNKEGFQKITDLQFELSLLKKTIDLDDFEMEDLEKYKIDTKLILDLLEDDDVKRYFESDKKLVKRFKKNYQELINWLKQK